MKKYLLILLIVISSLSLNANFIGMNNGTRALGMGNAFSAMYDAPECVFFNPAGCADINEYNMNVSYQNDYGVTDIRNMNLVANLPVNKYQAAIAFQQINLLDVLSENIIYINAAGKWQVHNKPIRLGLSAKYFMVGGDDADVEMDQPFDFDIGALYINKGISFAYTGKNFLRIAGEKDHIACVHILGAAAKWQDLLNLSADYEIGEDSSKHHFGIELWFYDTFAPRIGLDDEYLTMGFGLKSSWWNFDFGLKTHEKLGNTYRFGFNLKYKRSSL